ncbi:MAG TPA: ribonuclease R [Xanthobacteraceae bacterium]|nr:ribonuclease R [Xanthobacteraceae bacterium]
MSKKRVTQNVVPTRDEIVAFIRAQKGETSTRDIARAFGLKNADRAALKRILRELSDEGVVERHGKKMKGPEALPSTLIADVTERDAEGNLLAVPTEWDEEEKGPPPKIRLVIPRSPRPGTAAGLGDRALLHVDRNDDEDDAPWRGRVIRVLDRGKGRVLGIYRALPDGTGRLVPIDKKQADRELLIASGNAGDAADGDLVSVELTRARAYGPPVAKVKERLGSLKTERAISLIAIYSHDLPFVFPAAALKEAEAAKYATLKGREDWRNIPFVTIDPPDAKDHDDAVHAEVDTDPDNKGGYIVHVAIADVAFNVRPGSALDNEALKRGNSVYFPDRVVPMLPERISNDLCSLRPGEPRGALAVRLVLGANGRKKSHSFHRVLMRSVAKLSYNQVQAAIDGAPDEDTGPLLETLLKPLYGAYACAMKARKEREPLNLDLPERKILLRPDGTVDRVVTPERHDAHKLIEEFMILANVAAAETLEKQSLPLIYRVHDEPAIEKIHNLHEFLKTLEIGFAKSGALRPARFNVVLNLVKGADVEPLVNEVILRAQAQAEYTTDNYGHFGLNLRRYAHFTSPIRRYADLVVHRSLIRAMNLGDGALPETETPDTLGEVAAQISMAERRAMKAERETIDRLIAHHLADRVGAEFGARISGVTRAGLFVRLHETGADGLIPVRTLGTEYFQYDEGRHALIGTRSGVMYRLGDEIEVRLVEAAPVAGALRFEILEAGISPRSLRRKIARRGSSSAADSSRGAAPHGVAKPKGAKGKSDKKSKHGTTRAERKKQKAGKASPGRARTSKR